ncbi:glycosyltransferase family 32 protein [Faecalicoccus acidiformans]|uniref:glycosyltransferase family 32 protein n=1 Tax=Faecalicoccus acidiformans TaxID=915173 RepID=UPI0032097605
MIPHKIHYCWFGKTELGAKEKKCLESWKKFFPNYEIILWNENNYDVNKFNYMQEAYNLQKWAFVSDVARLDIIYNYGGIYLDTDVEVIAPFQDLIDKGAFMGIESFCNNNMVKVNPGLIIAAEPHNPVIKRILDSYSNDHFVNNNRENTKYTIVDRTTGILAKYYKLKNINEIQRLGNLTIYPKDYFCPMSYDSGELCCTKNTKTIHWFNASWLTKKQKERQKKLQKINKRFPKMITAPFGWFYLKIGAACDLYKEQGLIALLERLK